MVNFKGKISTSFNELMLMFQECLTNINGQVCWIVVFFFFYFKAALYCYTFGHICIKSIICIKYLYTDTCFCLSAKCIVLHHLVDIEQLQGFC